MLILEAFFIAYSFLCSVNIGHNYTCWWTKKTLNVFEFISFHSGGLKDYQKYLDTWLLLNILKTFSQLGFLFSGKFVMRSCKVFVSLICSEVHISQSCNWLCIKHMDQVHFLLVLGSLKISWAVFFPATPYLNTFPKPTGQS